MGYDNVLEARKVSLTGPLAIADGLCNFQMVFSVEVANVFLALGYGRLRRLFLFYSVDAEAVRERDCAKSFPDQLDRFLVQ